MPISPVHVANQRCRQTFSSRKMIEKTVTNKGFTNNMATASAIGIDANAKKNINLQKQQKGPYKYEQRDGLYSVHATRH